MSSSERVLLVPELAENILSQLEPRDLLYVYRPTNSIQFPTISGI